METSQVGCGTEAAETCRDEKKADPPFGHVTSLAVARTHRKLGIASKLMRAARALFGGTQCCLHWPLRACAVPAHLDA